MSKIKLCNCINCGGDMQAGADFRAAYDVCCVKCGLIFGCDLEPSVMDLDAMVKEFPHFKIKYKENSIGYFARYDTEEQAAEAWNEFCGNVTYKQNGKCINCSGDMQTMADFRGAYAVYCAKCGLIYGCELELTEMDIEELNIAWYGDDYKEKHKDNCIGFVARYVTEEQAIEAWNEFCQKIDNRQKG